MPLAGSPSLCLCYGSKVVHDSAFGSEADRAQDYISHALRQRGIDRSASQPYQFDITVETPIEESVFGLKHVGGQSGVENDLQILSSKSISKGATGITGEIPMLSVSIHLYR